MSFHTEINNYHYQLLSIGYYYLILDYWILFDHLYH